MEYLELIRKRYSVRAYKPDPVPDELLAQVLEAGRLAPTAANKQPFRIIVIHTKGREAELRRIYHRDWFTQAPLDPVRLHGAGGGVEADHVRRQEPRRRGRDHRHGSSRPGRG